MVFGWTCPRTLPQCQLSLFYTFTYRYAQLSLFYTTMPLLGWGGVGHDYRPTPRAQAECFVFASHASFQLSGEVVASS